MKVFHGFKSIVFILLKVIMPSLLEFVDTSVEVGNVDHLLVSDDDGPTNTDIEKIASATGSAMLQLVKTKDICFPSTPMEYQSAYSFFVYFPGNASIYEGILEELLNSMERCKLRRWNWKHIIIYPKKDLPETTSRDYFQTSINRLDLKKLKWNDQVYLIFQFRNKASFAIWEIYGFKHFFVNKQLTVSSNYEHNLVQVLPSIMISIGFTRNDFGGTELLTLGEDDPDYQSELTYKRYNQNESLEFASGLFVELLWDLKSMLNFTIRPVLGKGWISKGVNRSLTGIGDQILKGEADISVSFSQHAEYRLKYLYFLHPTFAGRDYAFFRQPEFSTNDKLLDPFQLNLWLGFGTTWVLIVFAHMILLKLRQSYYNPCAYLTELDIITMIAGSTAQKGIWNWSKNDHVTRLIQFFAVLMCVTLYMAYTATLVSHLTRTTIPIKTFDDLIRYNYIFLSTPRVSLIRFYVSDPEQAEKLIKISQSYYINESHSVAQVLSSSNPFAYINTLDTFFLYARQTTLSDEKICSKMSKISSGQHRNKCGMFLQKDSPLKETFNVKILIAIERGMTSRSVQRYTKKETLNCAKNDYKLEPARMQDISIAPIIYSFGIIASSFTSFLELIIFKARLTNRSQVEQNSDPRLVFRK